MSSSPILISISPSKPSGRPWVSSEASPVPGMKTGWMTGWGHQGTGVQACMSSRSPGLQGLLLLTTGPPFPAPRSNPGLAIRSPCPISQLSPRDHCTMDTGKCCLVLLLTGTCDPICYRQSCPQRGSAKGTLVTGESPKVAEALRHSWTFLPTSWSARFPSVPWETPIPNTCPYSILHPN